MPSASRDTLDSTVDSLWKFAVSNNTETQYISGFQLYKQSLLFQNIFWSNNDLPPVSEKLLMRFVAFCEEHKQLKYSTIKLYLCGIRFCYLKLAGFNPLECNGKPLECLQTILNGVKKKQKSLCKRTRLPITRNILNEIVFSLRKQFFSHFIGIMLEAACVVAFFAFLRCGEFTVLNKFDPEFNLCVSDVEIFSDRILLYLKKSKTDPFRQGVTIPLYKNNSDICPVTALNTYLAIRSSIYCKSDALFVTEEGNPLSRQFFISHLKKLLDSLGYPSENYNGHSLRIGAATTAHEVRLEDHLIKTLGRWSSDCYTRYIHTNPNVIRQAQNQLATLSNCTSNKGV